MLVYTVVCECVLYDVLQRCEIKTYNSYNYVTVEDLTRQFCSNHRTEAPVASI